MRALRELAFTRSLPVIPAYSDSGRRSTAPTWGVEGDSVCVVQDSGLGTPDGGAKEPGGTQAGPLPLETRPPHAPSALGSRINPDTDSGEAGS